VLFIIDGLGDVSVPSLGGRTPLQAAATPCLDALVRASGGLFGLLDPLAPGIACGSDAAHLSLLGYDPRLAQRGRGAFEALGAGLELRDGDVAFKCNFAVLDEERRVVTARRCDRDFERDGRARPAPRAPTTDSRAALLCAALDGLQVAASDGGPGAVVRVRYATEHRAGLLLRGPGLCDRVTGTDPLKDGRPLLRSQPLDGSADAAHTAHVVNAACDALRAALRGQPANAARLAEGRPAANVLLLRGPGCALRERPFAQQHAPYAAAAVAPTKIIAGLAQSLGMRLLAAPGATGDYRSELGAKAEAAAAALAAAPGPTFLLLHVKAVDDAGHDRAAALKVAQLRRCDALLGALARRLAAAGGEAARAVLAVTGDHSTPVSFGDHSCEPVPIALASLPRLAAALGGERALMQLPLDVPAEGGGPLPPPGAREEGGLRFDELRAARGGLGRFSGAHLMALLKDFAAMDDGD